MTINTLPAIDDLDVTQLELPGSDAYLQHATPWNVAVSSQPLAVVVAHDADDIRRAVRWAGRELRKRPASLILVARFVPIGRVAVNLTAGATHFPRSRFVAMTVFSAVLWGAYSVAIGLFFGQWFEENHLLGVIVAVICAMILGVLVDLAISRLRGRLPDDAEQPVPPAEAP